MWVQIWFIQHGCAWESVCACLCLCLSALRVNMTVVVMFNQDGTFNAFLTIPTFILFTIKNKSIFKNLLKINKFSDGFIQITEKQQTKIFIISDDNITLFFFYSLLNHLISPQIYVPPSTHTPPRQAGNALTCWHNSIAEPIFFYFIYKMCYWTPVVMGSASFCFSQPNLICKAALMKVFNTFELLLK